MEQGSKGARDQGREEAQEGAREGTERGSEGVSEGGSEGGSERARKRASNGAIAPLFPAGIIVFFYLWLPHRNGTYSRPMLCKLFCMVTWMLLTFILSRRLDMHVPQAVCSNFARQFIG